MRTINDNPSPFGSSKCLSEKISDKRIKVLDGVVRVGFIMCFVCFFGIMLPLLLIAVGAICFTDICGEDTIFQYWFIIVGTIIFCISNTFLFCIAFPAFAYFCHAFTKDKDIASRIDCFL